MTKISFYHDIRTSNKRGQNQIKIRISKNRQSAYINTDIWLSPSEWDPNAGIAVGPTGTANNVRLFSIMADVERCAADLRITGRMPSMSTTQIRDFVIATLDPEKSKRNKMNTFCSCFMSFMDSKTKPGTQKVYRTTWNHIHTFDPKIEDRNFEDIDNAWLVRFDAYMAKTSNKNARNINLRNIRAVFNHAIDEGITTSYPFRKFKIRPEPTRHRALSADQLATLRDCPCEPYQEKYRDMFMLMFYLIGINAADLFTAKPGDIVNGRLEYIRAKTGKRYSIKIEPEAKELMEKYRGESSLFCFMEERAGYSSFLKKMSRELKKIGTLERKGRGGKKVIFPLFPDISQYWCRHTWATLAAELDIPKETIAAGLGHEMGNSTTAIYINFNQRKVDEANRRVIDYVLYGKR